MRCPASLALALPLLSALLAGADVVAQPRPEGNGVYRIEGTVISLDKEASRITLRQRGASNIAWTVLYDDSTSFSYRNTITSLEDVKVGRRVICLGRFAREGGKNEMTAVIVDVRTGKQE